MTVASAVGRVATIWARRDESLNDRLRKFVLAAVESTGDDDKLADELAALVAAGVRKRHVESLVALVRERKRLMPLAARLESDNKAMADLQKRIRTVREQMDKLRAQLLALNPELQELEIRQRESLVARDKLGAAPDFVRKSQAKIDGEHRSTLAAIASLKDARDRRHGELSEAKRRRDPVLIATCKAQLDETCRELDRLEHGTPKAATTGANEWATELLPESACLLEVDAR